MKSSRANLIGRCWLAAATVLAGGTVLGTCEVRLHDAFVTSTKSLVLGVFEIAAGNLTADLATNEDAETITE